MAPQSVEMKALADDLKRALDAMPPHPVELVGFTGELFSPEALNLALVYDTATNAQRSALDQIAKAFKAARP